MLQSCRSTHCTGRRSLSGTTTAAAVVMVTYALSDSANRISQSSAQQSYKDHYFEAYGNERNDAGKTIYLISRFLKLYSFCRRRLRGLVHEHTLERADRVECATRRRGAAPTEWARNCPARCCRGCRCHRAEHRLTLLPGAGQLDVYFAMEAAVIPAYKTAQLSLMIDVGNGLWQVISTADCNPAFVLARHSLDIPSWLSANLEKEGGESKLSAQLCRSPMQAQ